MEELMLIPSEGGIRIDKYVSDECQEISRSFVQKMIEAGDIFLQNAPDRKLKSNYKLSAGECVIVRIHEPKEAEIEPEDIPLDIIYEDSDLLIINKSKKMVVHPSNGHYSGTVVNAVMFHCKNDLSGINGVMRPGIVHRIVQNTTGSLIIRKNDFSHNHIAKQLKVHSITRKYVAIVHGNLKEEDGTIHTLIGRHPTDRKKMSVNCKNGKEAITHYHVLERFSNYTFIECTLETGRTHQIRVHMASIGHPILGDDVYGPSKCPVKNLIGQTLHAKTIGFIHPKSEQYVEFEAPLPEYFENLLKKLRTSN